MNLEIGLAWLCTSIVSGICSHSGVGNWALKIEQSSIMGSISFHNEAGDS